MILADRQKAILIGSVLGDGGFYGGGKNRSGNCYYYLKQSKEHREYVEWVYAEMQNLCGAPPKEKNDIHRQWYFITRSDEAFTALRKMFYAERKMIPRNIGELLIDPLSIAVWYMEDGTLDWRIKDHYAYRLVTNCFSIDENQTLVSVLKKNFGIDATVQTTLIRGKRYPRIHIGRKGRDAFLRCVEPHIIGCFRYKLPPSITKPSETSYKSKRWGLN